MKRRGMGGSVAKRSMRLVGVLVAVGIVGMSAGLPRAYAEIGSDKAAAILVFPKLLVNTESNLDTMIRISNISEQALNVLCFYVNVTPQCSLPNGSCFPDRLACPVTIEEQLIFGECRPQWQQTDFVVRLTREQPTGWLVSEGESVNCQFLSGVCSKDGITDCQRDSTCLGAGNRCVLPPCLPLDGQIRRGRDGQTNEASLVPLSPEDPFIGELKCIAVDETLTPVARNDLIGEALIGLTDEAGNFVDIAGYNAIGIPAIADTGNRDGVLVLGGPTGKSPDENPADRQCLDSHTCAEYEGCPNILILDHFFDGAVDPLIHNVCLENGACSVTPGVDCATDVDCLNTCEAGPMCKLDGEDCAVDEDCSPLAGRVRVATDLTLIPCTQDFESRNLDLSRTVAQFLVFNEFEQRFSTSRTVTCFKETRLSNIDGPDNTRSIFSAGVAGTLTGQTRIRGVVTAPLGGGNALLGIAEEFRCRGSGFPLCSFVNPTDLISSTGNNLQFQGRRPQGDYLYLP